VVRSRGPARCEVAAELWLGVGGSLGGARAQASESERAGCGLRVEVTELGRERGVG
jgi:hypothetical protein